MAYVLGYFAADGCMLKNKRGAHFIEFTSIDIELLLSIQNAIGSNHSISVRNRFTFNQNIAYRLQIGSKQIFNDLSNLGFTSAKSNSLQFPSVPMPYFSHFTRGYFDGDGHVSIIKRLNRPSSVIQSGFTSGSQKFLTQLHTDLKKYARIKGGSFCYRKGYRLNFSIKDSLLLYKYIYKDSDNLFLARKRLAFERYYNV